jgi:Thiolase, C-terminal domain
VAKIVRGNRRKCLVNKLAALHSPLEDTSAEVGVAEYAATHVCEYKVIAALTDHEGGQLFRPVRRGNATEINEAFAAVALASAQALDIDDERLNVHGGAIALGHPLGMSGARPVLHVALELRRRGAGIGVAALCGGGGQGDALILRR